MKVLEHSVSGVQMGNGVLLRNLHVMAEVGKGSEVSSGARDKRTQPPRCTVCSSLSKIRSKEAKVGDLG